MQSDQAGILGGLPSGGPSGWISKGSNGQPFNGLIFLHLRILLDCTKCVPSRVFA